MRGVHIYIDIRIMVGVKGGYKKKGQGCGRERDEGEARRRLLRTKRQKSMMI